MKPIKTFTVSPVIPEKLKRLKEIAYNLWWTWDSEARDLFRRLDMDLWEQSRHNPVLVLNHVDQEVLDKRANDESFLYMLTRVAERFDLALQQTTWFQRENKFNKHLNIAYFSMEYGITESLAVYSGGLGVLSGDHLKSSSDLGIPLYAVGLSYQKGYFQQSLNADDWQEEKLSLNDFCQMPLILETDEKGNPRLIEIPFPGRIVFVQIWKASVGRIPLYLLDANIPNNSSEDRLITAELYGGDKEMRIKQEIVLGIGGVKALKCVGTPACVCHMNEGHSAFSGLERIRSLVAENNLSFQEALEIVKASSVFTTHTPVEAGIDIFSPELIRKYFQDYCKSVNIGIEDLMAFGRKDPTDSKEEFSMAILAIKLSYITNAVSKLHRRVSQSMWQSLWPDILTKEIPIISVTNGIHHHSWISAEMSDLFNRYLGPEWSREPAGVKIWDKVRQIPDGELWRTHERRRERLVAFSRSKLVSQYRALDKSPNQIARVRGVLNTEALTIGFARRFATYKRATLIFSNPERLARILNNKDFPVQIIIAGKAHPQDNAGKKFIQQILKLSHEEPFYQKVAFLENYDMNTARYMVQGCDLWLNTPRRSLEACGTSGMKATANGALNFSTLDGWWDEIYEPGIGWAIGTRDEYDDMEMWDRQEAYTLYNILETEIIPTFFKRDNDGLPREWINLMKNSMSKICPLFNTNRMLEDYTNYLYDPAVSRVEQLYLNNFAVTRELANWKQRIRQNWTNIRFLEVQSDPIKGLQIDSQLGLSAKIYLDGIEPSDIDVQVYYGRLDSNGNIFDGELSSLQLVEKLEKNNFLFKGTLNTWESGLNGFTLRIIPKHEALGHPFEDGLIHWFET